MDRDLDDGPAIPKCDLVMPTCNGIDIEELSISQLQHHLGKGMFTSRDLSACYLERIKQLNGVLKAVIELNPDALEIANEMDRERRDGKCRGLLHGIPFLVKDNISTCDRMQTTAGSSALIGTTVREDARVVSHLRNAGAVLLGHANMTEWACVRASYYSEGYSTRGGQCRNPYDLTKDPGGSSSGSAVAVATNMCAFSLGTETDGSVIFPADRNGIVGIKPSLGLISCHGVIPDSRNFDVVGTFGRTVADAAAALDIIAGNTDGKLHSSLATSHALKGAFFGMPWKRVWETASKTGEHFRVISRVISHIKEAGADFALTAADIPSVEEIIPPTGWDWEYGSRNGHPEQCESTVIKTDFYNDINAYLSSLDTNPNDLKSLEDIVDYNLKHDEGGMPGMHPAWPTGQDMLERCLTTHGIEDDIYHQALAFIRQKSREEGIDAALSSARRPLDGLLVPVYADGGVSCQLAAKAGYPMITIPAGLHEDGIPFGLGIIQTAGREDLLVKYGSAIEDLISARTKPLFSNIGAANYLFVGPKPE